MLLIRSYSRLVWIALAAIVAMSSASEAGSTCPTKPKSRMVCGKVCCCGETSAPDSRSATPSAINEPTLAPVSGFCDAAGCVCESQSPVAPASEETNRPAESRPDPGRAVSVIIDDVAVVRGGVEPTLPPVSRSWRKWPVYLQNARLLI
jgi:hypothetical protein